VKVIALDAPKLFDFDGNPYQMPDGSDREGNGLRYAAFSRVAADVSMGRHNMPAFDVVHAHDWQAGLVPAYLSTEAGRVPRSVLTIHNLAFQGIFPKRWKYNLMRAVWGLAVCCVHAAMRCLGL